MNKRKLTLGILGLSLLLVAILFIYKNPFATAGDDADQLVVSYDVIPYDDTRPEMVNILQNIIGEQLNPPHKYESGYGTTWQDRLSVIYKADEDSDAELHLLINYAVTQKDMDIAHKILKLYFPKDNTIKEEMDQCITVKKDNPTHEQVKEFEINNRLVTVNAFAHEGNRLVSVTIYREGT